MYLTWWLIGFILFCFVLHVCHSPNILYSLCLQQTFWHQYISCFTQQDTKVGLLFVPQMGWILKHSKHNPSKILTLSKLTLRFHITHSASPYPPGNCQNHWARIHTHACTYASMHARTNTHTNTHTYKGK